MRKKQREVLDLAIKEMMELKESSDREMMHCSADDILLIALRELGFGELADAYDEVSEIGFWYA